MQFRTERYVIGLLGAALVQAIDPSRVAPGRKKQRNKSNNMPVSREPLSARFGSSL